MKCYEVEVGCGVMYFIAAPNMIRAMQEAINCWESEGSLDDISTETDITIAQLPKGFAEKVQIRLDGEGEGVKKSFWELAQKCEKAELIGCSEW